MIEKFEKQEKKNQQFRVIDDRNIMLTFSGTKSHYQFNLCRVHIDQNLGVNFK